MKLLLKNRWCRALCSRSEVGVFWDLNKCGVEDVEMGEGKAEATVDASHIVPNIVKVLRSSGFFGPISIRAYGNTRSFSNHRVTQALLATGVDLHHVPGGINDLWKHLILDLLLWVRENSSPAHVLLISGNKEYSSVLHKLHMRGYDVLLAHPEGDMSRHLLSAASKVWVWDKMIRGTEVSTSQLTSNVLPHSYRLQNSDKSQCGYSQEVQPEPDVKHDFICQDSKRKSQNIPREVVDQVLDIIRSKPSGFTVSAFRRQLARSNITLDKDFYGHKDVLSFLLSIPNLKARLIWTTDRTRAFYFTEDRDASPTLNDEGKEALSFMSDHSKYAKQEMIKAEPEKKHSGIKVKNALCNNMSRKESSSKGSFTGLDSSSVNSAAKSPGFFTRGTEALSAVWNKTLSKLIAFKKSVGPEASGIERTYTKLSSPKKGEESKLKIEDINAELRISSVPSPTPEKKGDTLHKKKLRQTIEVDIHEALVGEQEYRKSQWLRKSNVSASCDFAGNWQTVSGKNSASQAQGRHCGLLNELEATSPLLNEAKVAITDARLTDEMCDDVLWYLMNEGSTLFTRSVTGDDVLKFLLASNLKGIAELKQEELIQLSKKCHELIMSQVESRNICNTKSKATGYDRVLAEEESSSAFFSTVRPDAAQLNDDDEGGIAVPSSQAQDKVNCFRGLTLRNEDSSSIEQPHKPEADVRRDLKEMLLDLFNRSFESEVELASVKPEFKTRYGYDLDNKFLGYSKLSSFLISFGGFTIIQRPDKKLVLRSREHAVDKERVDEGNKPTFEVSH